MSTSAPDPNANRRPSPSAANETVPTPSISAPASPVRYRSFGCPRCRTRLSATKAEVGSVVVCPDCDEKIVVPDYLDFETETDYERFNNPQKRRQDELLSPARNPNRVGIDVAGADIYGVKEKVDATVKNGSGVAGEASSGTASGQNKGESEAVFYPTRCRICETLTQAPAELLGKTVRCPDCGAETVVTAALKEQLATTDVRFQPRDRGVYELGEIPEAPDRVYQRFDGKTVFVPNSAKTIAPKAPERFDASIKCPEKRKKRQSFASKGETTTGATKAKTFGKREERERRRRFEELKAEFGTAAVDEALRKTNATGKSGGKPENAEKTSALDKVGVLGEKREFDRAPAVLSVLTAPFRLVARLFRRLAVPPEIENPNDFLPPLVLRYRDGEALWTRPGPPRRWPLFNRTFQALATNELWARGGSTLACGVGASFYFNRAIEMAAPAGNAGAFEKWFFLGMTLFAVPLIAYWGYLAASCFEACFVAGASGARRVVEWRRDDFWETALYLLGGGALIAATLTPGAAFDATFRLLEGGAEASAEVVGAEAALGGDWRFAGALAGSFALCFPIFYLSTLYSNWLFAPICGAVLSSFLRRIVVWAQFWAVSAAVVFAPLALAIHYWGTTAFFRGAPLAVAVCPALYGLLLGRLAWILDEDERSLEYDD